MSLNTSLTSEIQKLSPSAMIELYILDATDLGGTIFRFHSGTNELNQNIVWQGETYLRFPIKITGFEYNGQGQFPRPKVQVSNALSAITTLLIAYGDLLGAKITRKRTLAKFLDAVNFPGAVNPTADPTAEFDEDIYYIDRKSSEDRDIVEFELASSLDLVGVQLPRRQVVQNVCTWKYRGPECGFTGPTLYDLNDKLLSSTATTLGQAVIAANQAIINATTDLANKEAALTVAAQAVGPSCDYQFQNRYVSSGGYPYGVIQWNGVVTRVWFNGTGVSLGSIYRMGAFFGSFVDSNGQQLDVYYIEVWGINSSQCSSAQSAYNTALTNRNNAITALQTANNNLVTAMAALPADDPIWTQDQCGKRLLSCKLRFGENNSLPFGSFPAAGLIK